MSGMSDVPPIVCAIDGSEPASGAVAASRWLALELDAPVVLVHVVDPMAVAVPPARDLAFASMASDDLVRAQRQAAQNLLDEATATLGGVAHQSELIDDRPVNGLLDAVRRHGAGVVVAGTAARTGLDRVLIGSVASDLAAQAPCPLIVVPPGAQLERPGPVVAAHDGSDHSLRGARHASALAARMGRKLVLLHVAGDDEEPVRADSELGTELFRAGQRAMGGRALDLEVEIAIEEGDPVATITTFADSHDAALIVVGSRGRGAVAAALVGSVSAGVVRNATRPVVLVPPVAGAPPGLTTPAWATAVLES